MSLDSNWNFKLLKNESFSNFYVCCCDMFWIELLGVEFGLFSPRPKFSPRAGISPKTLIGMKA